MNVHYVSVTKSQFCHLLAGCGRPCQRENTIGRIYAVYPSDPGRWHLRLLLNNVTGATSFDNLYKFRGVYASFRMAALARGLLQNDHYLEDTMEEANIHTSAHF
jgi:hypothetical protein